jgi:ketosteroid isomerase-like protein
LSTRKAAVEAYFEGFRQTDRAGILALLTDDVVWDLPGYKHLEGKAAFDGEIVGEGFEGQPMLQLDRLIEEGDTVVAIGSGSASQTDGSTHRFVYCDVFTFTGDLIRRVESYLVPLTAAD